MDQVTHFLFLAALTLIIVSTLIWLSGMSCAWGFLYSRKDVPGQLLDDLQDELEDVDWEGVGDSIEAGVESVKKAAKDLQLGKRFPVQP